MNTFDFERAERMAELYRSGMTLQQIGTAYAMTRERVRQIIKRVGLTRSGGGVTARKQKRQEKAAAAALARKDARALIQFGCTHAEVLAINDGASAYKHGTPVRAFIQQRKNAAVRGIEWQMTLPEWWALWEPQWHLRTRTQHGLVMARKQDLGPYAPWNVHLIPNSKNVSDYQSELRKRGVMCADGYRRLPERAASIGAR